MSAKIEELRFRLKTDPKSRLFYPLAEELRKAGQVDEAEQVLRTGLVVHPAYLSAWVSLGRVLRDQKKDGDAVDALTRALELDPGNVVAARILGDAYLNLGDKVEAIKKYKLVHALMPGDSEVEGIVESLDAELNPPARILEVGDEVEAVVTELDLDRKPADTSGAAGPQPADDTGRLRADRSTDEEDSPFDRTMPPFAETATADEEPMRLAHEESPFEEPVSDYTASALTVEAPVGMHIDEAPAEEEAAPPPEVTEEADVFAPTEDVTNTITMGDLYAHQGLADEARQIYENVLARDPQNDEVREKLEALSAAGAEPESGNPKIARLSTWLSKVSRKEVGGV